MSKSARKKVLVFFFSALTFQTHENKFSTAEEKKNNSRQKSWLRIVRAYIILRTKYVEARAYAIEYDESFRPWGRKRLYWMKPRRLTIYAATTLTHPVQRACCMLFHWIIIVHSHSIYSCPAYSGRSSVRAKTANGKKSNKKPNSPHTHTSKQTVNAKNLLL